MPDEAEVFGLLALMLLQDSRRAARVGDDGELVLLEDQDRALWDRAAHRRGAPRARPRRRRSAARARTSSRRAIAAAHAEERPWIEIVLLYDRAGRSSIRRPSCSSTAP